MVAFGKITRLAGVCALSMALFSCSRTTDDGQGTNRPPVIENLPTLKRGKTSSAGELLLRAQDPDGDPVRWSLEESDCSFGVSIFPEGKATWSCPAEEERCEVGVIVRDDSSASASGDFEIACVRSMGSFSGAAPETAREGEPYLYKAICEDEEGAALEVTHGEEDTCGGSLDEVNGQTHYRFTPGEEDGGSTCVLDLACGGETQRATITIVEVNLPPKITIENAVLTAQVGEQGHITFAVSDDDLPAQNITVEASPQGCDISPTVDGARVSWTCEEAVTCELVLEASDDFTPAASARTTTQIICTADTRPHLTELSISPTRPLPREALACQPTYSHLDRVFPKSGKFAAQNNQNAQITCCFVFAHVCPESQKHPFDKMSSAAWLRAWLLFLLCQQMARGLCRLILSLHRHEQTMPNIFTHTGYQLSEEDRLTNALTCLLEQADPEVLQSFLELAGMDEEQALENTLARVRLQPSFSQSRPDATLHLSRADV